MTLPLRRSAHSKVELLREKLLSAWARSDEIFAILPPQEMLTQPIVWRHPFIFYVGHLPAFSWNQVCGALLGWESCNSEFDELFCRGIDPDVDTGECHWHPDVPEEWPTLFQTTDYRDNVREQLLAAVEAISDGVSTDVMAQNGRGFQMVLEHEAMHQETLLYMLQQLPLVKKLRPRIPLRYFFRPVRDSEMVRISAGKARLGARFEALDFGWDNEFDQAIVDVPAFAIDSLPVTNGQYFEFICSGAYEDSRYWRAEDWRWKQLENKHAPTCWFKQGEGWFYRAMFDVFALSQVYGWPVYVSLAEARAFAKWRGQRLPSEAEFHRAAFYGPDGVETTYPWGEESAEYHHGNFDFNSWSPVPVGSRAEGASRWGVFELFGNGWELTDSEFAPFAGFIPYIAGYPDYSQDFFDGKHFVLKGGSWATSADLLRPSFRNWYQAHYPYVFAKFRCVAN
jgi:ergothioneine biosynthesis protein EgtB